MHDGILYLYNIDNIIQALDARDRRAPVGKPHPALGRDRRRHRRDAQHRDLSGQALRRVHRRAHVRARCPHRTHGVGHGDRQQREGLRQFVAARSIINGTIVQGLGGCERYKAAPRIRAATSPASMRRRAGFSGASTRSRAKGQPGGDTWGNLPNMLRAGGDTWITGTYDPDLNLTYWGVAQAKPWMQASRGTTGNDVALYTSSTLALRPDTGQLAWHFQHAPGELLDLDEVYERVLVDVDGRKLSFNIGKVGILWKLDRQPASSSTPRRPCSRTSSSGRTESKGMLRLSPRHPRADAPAIGFRPAPARTGGKDWQTMSYDPAHEPARHSADPGLHGDQRPRRRAEGRLGRHDGRPQILRDAGLERQHGQARRLRRAHDGAEMDLRSARRMADRRADDRRRASPLSAISTARSTPSIRRRARSSGSRGSAPRCRASRSRSASAASNISRCRRGWAAVPRASCRARSRPTSSIRRTATRSTSSRCPEH